MKKFLALFIAAALVTALLASCGAAPEMTFTFIEGEEASDYSSLVEGSAMTVYVDAAAPEGGDGSEGAPFQNIPQAQAKIRELKAGEGLPAGGITVFVKDGEYRLAEGLIFTAEDSGTEECPITYVSESEFGAKLTGALLLSAEDFEPLSPDEKARIIDQSAADNIVKVDLKEYGLTSEDWGHYVSMGSHHTGALYDDYDPSVPPESEVFIGDRALVCARWPNKDWIYPGVALDIGENLVNGLSNTEPNPEGPTFRLSDAEVERISKWADPSEAWTFGYISATWAESRNKVEIFDLDAKSMHLKYSESYLNNDGDTIKYYYFNIFEELDHDGEFYIDRENGILYVYKTADFYTERIKLSTLTDSLITLNDVSNLTIKGFYISETRGDGIVGSGTAVTVDNCKILNIRSNGITLNGTKITIQNSELCNLGAAGITLSGGDSWNLIKADNLVYNNYIHDWARVETTYKTGISVNGCGLRVAHNELGNSPHQAVSWGGQYIILEYNEVYNVLTETSDCGAFYTGRTLTSYGCEIRYNYIHDIGYEGADANGIYFDDGFSGQKTYGNLVVNVSGYGFLIGGGRDNYICNNVIVNAGKCPLYYDYRTMKGVRDPSFWFQHAAPLAAGLAPFMENEIWMEAFPEYEGMILYYTGYTGNLDDPNLSCVSANCVVKNNIAYVPMPQYEKTDSRKLNFAFDYEDGLGMFNEITKNFVLTTFGDFPGWHNDDYRRFDDSRVKRLCPEFESLPIDKMGRVQ